MSLKGLEPKDIELLLEDTLQVEVSIPKTTQLYFSSNGNISIDYAFAAFAGQKLAEASSSFEFQNLEPHERKNFLFELGVTDSSKLANAIYQLSILFNDPDDDDLERDFESEDVWNFIDEVKAGDIVPVCPYYVEVCEEYRKEEGDDE